MGSRCFDSPVLFMKLGITSNHDENPTLGEAIAHVLEQPSDEHYLFDIITEDGLINHACIREIARTEAFAHWRNQDH
ncbi:hypothetical protein [Novosphingobium terrae]|uniref:hypothetical protein n=1 Tax=Novosphingobium terrae TaxID=2726189 RepID=UPI00198186DB|nr:hypothetical protein [Novosphingobium terrae]